MKDNLNFHLHILGIEDYNSLLYCIDCVRDSINTGYYVPSSDLEIIEILSDTSFENHLAIGIFFDEKLIAFTTLSKIKNSFLDKNVEIKKGCFCIEDTVVLPEFRGRQLQIKMWEHIFAMRNTGEKIIFSIHPDNVSSLTNALALKMQIINQVQIYNNLPRLLLYKEI